MSALGVGRRGGFSMVEVILALGLVTFCIVALVALFPVGLGSVKASKEEAAAINCLEQISESIRGATLRSGSRTDYRALGGYQGLAWSVAGKESTTLLSNLSASGFPAQQAEDTLRFAARVRIVPPSGPHAAGTAYISVAWPAQAAWNTEKSDWQNAQGAVHTCLVFLPGS